MKVLLAHNYYRSSSPSGEDAVFEAERDLLAGRGVEVVTYVKRNDDIAGLSPAGKIGLPVSTGWSRSTLRDLGRLLAREKPDVAHFHNLWYLITPSAHAACRAAGVPVVQTLHNFRAACLNGLLLRDGEVCEECLGRPPWRGVLHGCWRGSRIASLILAAAAARQRRAGAWTTGADVYIALSRFAREKLIAAGLPEERILVKPNFLASPPPPAARHLGYAAFLGRLAGEKGLATLLAAARRLGRRLPVTIVGDGPLRRDLDEAARGGEAALTVAGRKPRPECLRILDGARFLVLPSICYEGFPLAILEAFACGKPVVASRLGSLAELVEEGKTGLLFEPGNAVDLASKMTWMLEHEAEAAAMGRNARAVFDERYTAGDNFDMLMGIYRTAAGRPRGRS